MKRDRKSIAYSYEHGNESLLHLKDMVSEVEDPEKNKIMSYLRTHCIVASPGVIRDEISPDEIIGCGNIYSDGVYYWDDAFFNYVERYNIPVPEEFRDHIMANYEARNTRHLLLNSVDQVMIRNNPYLGYTYEVAINRNGIIKYRNNTECKDGKLFNIKPDDAAYIIDPIMSEFFCYDVDNHGEALIDGYHWKLAFYKKDKLIEKTDGWPNEDLWRYREIKSIIRFAERFISENLGADLMNYYAGREEDISDF